MFENVNNRVPVHEKSYEIHTYEIPVFNTCIGISWNKANVKESDAASSKLRIIKIYPNFCST